MNVKENKLSLVSGNEARIGRLTFHFFPLRTADFFYHELFYKFKNEFIVSIFISYTDIIVVLIEVNINRIEMTTIFGLAKLHCAVLKRAWEL